MRKIEEVIGHAATNIAKEINANGILCVESLPGETYQEENEELNVKVVIFKKIEEKKYKKVEFNTKIKNREFSSIAPVKKILMEAISKNYINKGERIVCIESSSVSLGYQGVLFIFDVDETFFKISRQKLSESIPTEVIESIISIAKEIGEEGREGKKIGTAFIIGDPSELSKYTKQLIINPFISLEEKPKITDPKIRETIKEFAQLDGAFFLNKEGEVLSAGTYININHSDINLPDGFGTRHRACCALTDVTNTIAVIVSQSGGIVRVIKNGKIILKI